MAGKTEGGLRRCREAPGAFSEEEVRRIRAADRQGASRKAAAALYGVSRETIAKLCRGDTYWWVGEAVPASAPDVGESLRRLQGLLREPGE